MSIAQNLEKIHQGIAKACEKSGRTTQDVQLIAVSKTKPIELIQEAFETGQLHFGENQVQELTMKQPTFPDEVQWHLIGHLQSNKIRKALPCCDLIHTVDSIKVAESIDRISGELNRKTKYLLQINISKDEAKYGFASDEAKSTLESLLDKKNIELQGLMTIPAFDPDPEVTRVHFASLRELRDQLEEQLSTSLPHLSMGMSHDHSVAIEEGATLVRVGSSIFGSRG